MESLLRPNGQAALCSAHSAYCVKCVIVLLLLCYCVYCVTAYCVECARNIFGWREAISYAVIIYSSLGMEEEAFTGMINIFGLRGLLGTCHLNLPHLPLSQMCFPKGPSVNRRYYPIGQPIYSPIYFHSRLGGVWTNLFLGCCGELPPESNIIFKKDCCTVQDPRYLH